MSPTAPPLDWTAIGIFLACFALVTVMGFVAARWKRPATMAHLDEWGLGGRQFGPWITWFLLGGDLYTAYTVIAVPALVYGVGGFGFFALPYVIIVFPFAYILLPRLWEVAARSGCVTAADVVHRRYRSRPLELAVAVTGVIATMPYIALQLVGLQVVIKGLGLPGEISLAVAFLVLALFTYSSGLRAPAMIAFVKDTMIYAVVIVAVIVVPIKLGGFGAIFSAADAAFQAKGGMTGMILKPPQMLPYATLALGSAFALFMYPHALTGVFAARDPDTLRRNAVWMPAYTILLGGVALLGLMAYAAGVHVKSNSDVVPALFAKLFPSWFVGFAYAGIGVGALVPAAVMSIGAANLFTRNFWKAYINPMITHAGEAAVAKLVSLAVKVGALACIVFLPTQFALDLQLLGGMWILQIFPAVVFGLFTDRMRAPGLLAGWIVGFVGGTAIVFSDGLKPVHVLAPGIGVYVGLIALVLNIAVAALVSALLAATGRKAVRV